MTNVLRWIMVVLLTGHGLIHVLGAAKGLGWAEVDQLQQPIGGGAGVLWLLAGLLVLAAGAALLAAGAPTWWWVLAVTAAACSQVAVATSWSRQRHQHRADPRRGLHVRLGRTPQLPRTVA